MTGSDYQIETIESAPFAENSYVLWRRGGREALVVDPGFDTDSILEWLDLGGPARWLRSSTPTATPTTSPAMRR